MAKLMNEIQSLRKCNQQFYNEVMYEWEDEIVACGFRLVCRSRISKYFWSATRKILRKNTYISQSTPRLIGGGKLLKVNKLAFLMFVSQFKEHYPSDIIPIFVDTRVKSFDVLVQAIKNVDIAIITNRSAWEKAKVIYPEKNLFTIPLWCSEKWRLDGMPKKKLDVLQIGRRNKLLHEWMLRHVENNPNIEYVYKLDDSVEYFSTKKGNIGALQTREDYMKRLRETRVCLVSSPLVDSDSDFDFITPRVYESAMSYCRMVGRFTHNDEYHEIGLGRIVCPAPDYETFSTNVTRCLNEGMNGMMSVYSQFINDNSFDKRWKRLSEILGIENENFNMDNVKWLE